MKNIITVVYQNKVKADSNNNAPIYCRIKAYGTTKEFSFGYKVNIDRWKDTDGLTKSKVRYTDKELEIKSAIDNKISKFTKYANRQDEDGNVYTAEMVFNSAENPNPHKGKTLLHAFDEHKKEFFRLVYIGERKESGYKKYCTVRTHIEKFTKQRYNEKDRLLSLVDNDFQKDFQVYLIGKVGQNAIGKYVQHLRTVTDYVKSKGWVKDSRLEHYSIKKVKLKKVYLTLQEVLTISKKKMPIKRLAVVKDIFLFNILTGYAWTDVSKLVYSDIHQISKGFQIMTDRNKTGIEANVVLTGEAMMLIDKYRSDEECIATGKLFPFSSNQKMNAYLKEVQNLCKIDKELTTKVARNTYATLCLNNGVMLKALSKSMGHTTTRMTESYASLVNETLVSEMKKMEGILHLRVA